MDEILRLKGIIGVSSDLIQQEILQRTMPAAEVDSVAQAQVDIQHLEQAITRIVVANLAENVDQEKLEQANYEFKAHLSNLESAAREARPQIVLRILEIGRFAADLASSADQFIVSNGVRRWPF